MDISYIWGFALSVAAPIAGIVGFSIQLREVKKTRLENEKLLLEIQVLKTKARANEQRIVQATNEEVLRISHPDVPMFTRKAKTQDHEYISTDKHLRKRAIESAIVLAALFVLAYFLYDLYRLFHWLANTL
jgi:hypothetical protein